MGNPIGFLLGCLEALVKSIICLVVRIGRRYTSRMPNRITPCAYTVAAFANEGEQNETVALYGVLAVSVDCAIDAVRQIMPPYVHIELAGTLTVKVARALCLKLGEAQRL